MEIFWQKVKPTTSSCINGLYFSGDWFIKQVTGNGADREDCEY